KFSIPMSKKPVPSSPAASCRRLQKMGSPSSRGQHDQTMRPRRSTSAATMLLPMTARLRSCIAPFPPSRPRRSRRHHPAQPCPPPARTPCRRGRRGRDPPARRRGGGGADGGAAPAEPARRGKSVAIGGVVPEEERPAPREGRLLHERDHGLAFAVGPLLDLQDH